MANTPGPKSASPQFRADIARWHQREHDILSGKAIPTAQDRKRGHSAFEGSPLLDLRQAIDVEISRDQVSAEALTALETCRAVPTADNCWSVYQHLGGHGEIEQIYLWHAAIRGHEQAVPMLAIATMQSRSPHDRVGWMMAMALALGLMASYGVFHPDDGLEAEDLAECRSAGMAKMRLFGTLADEFDADVEESEHENLHAEKPASGLDAALAAMAAMTEDRAEIVLDWIPKFEPAPPEAPGRVVVASSAIMARSESKYRAEVLSSVRSIIGKDLPLIGTEKLADVRVALLESHPHCGEVIDRMLMPQAGRPFFNGRWLFVGSQGSGKSSLARALAKALGLPIKTINGASEADSTFGGTPAAYGTAAISTPLRLISQSGIANPLIHIDEIEKAATGRQNGNFMDALLQFLEPGTAAAYEDPALQAPVDLSAVSYICTGNGLEGVPAPLLDRLTVIRVPDPTWEHIGPLSRSILRDIARKQGLDDRWPSALSPDELDVIKLSWGGGSLRRLAKVLETFSMNRERSHGGAN